MLSCSVILDEHHRKPQPHASFHSAAIKTHQGFCRALLSLTACTLPGTFCSPGFESDLYISHLRGNILILQRPHTYINTHIPVGMHTYGGRAACRMHTHKDNHRHNTKHSKRDVTTIKPHSQLFSEACWGVYVCKQSANTPTHTLPRAQITFHKPQNNVIGRCVPHHLRQSLAKRLTLAGSQTAAWVSAHLDSMWVKLSAGGGQVRSGGHSPTSTLFNKTFIFFKEKLLLAF